MSDNLRDAIATEVETFFGDVEADWWHVADAILALPEMQAVLRDAAIGARLREIGQSLHWSAQGAINDALGAT